MLTLLIASTLGLILNAAPVTAILNIKGHDVPMSAKESGLVELIRSSPGSFADYRTVHAWTGWTTSFDPPRVRQLIKPVNLKSLEYAGTPVLKDDRGRGGLALVEFTPKPSAEQMQRQLLRVLQSRPANLAGELTLTEHEYLSLGLPRAELLAALAPLAMPSGFRVVTIELLTFYSTTAFDSKRRSHWYARPAKRRCNLID